MTATRPRSNRTRGSVPDGGRSLTAMNGPSGAGALPAAIQATLNGAVSGDSWLSRLRHDAEHARRLIGGRGRQQQISTPSNETRRQIGEIVRGAGGLA